MNKTYALKKIFTLLLLLLVFSLCLLLFKTPAHAAGSKSYKNTFRTVKGKIYYYNNKGKKLKSTWKTIDGNRYYFCSDGRAATGFKTIRKKKYFFSSQGIMHTGWYQKGTKTYYFNTKTGIMATGWNTIGGNKYHFSSSGVMTKNNWINGKYLDPNGIYDSSKKQPLTQLEKKLRSAIKGYYGTWTIYVKNLDTNESICINNKKLYAASLIKLYAMGAAYEKIQQGKLRESSVSSTIRSMISVSSNDAFNTVVKRIGKTYISKWCKANGFKSTKQIHGLSPSSNNSGLRTGSGSNVTTVKDCGLLLEQIYRGTCVSKSASKKMLNHLKAQQRRSKIPAGVPSGVKVANKTGETNDTTHDAAIVYSKGADYILCVMAKCPGRAWYSERNIPKLSRITYNYFN